VVVTNGNDEPIPALHQQDVQVFEDGYSESGCRGGTVARICSALRIWYVWSFHQLSP
jgi:hypothetical protein